jgi:hypothetical protein
MQRNALIPGVGLALLKYGRASPNSISVPLWQGLVRGSRHCSIPVKYACMHNKSFSIEQE